jgi:hypothetical protein
MAAPFCITAVKISRGRSTPHAGNSAGFSQRRLAKARRHPQIPPTRHKDQPVSPMRAIALLSTLQSADIVLPTTDGREIRLRRLTEPTAEQKSLFRQLGISLPEHLQRHRECSVDSAIA